MKKFMLIVIFQLSVIFAQNYDYQAIVYFDVSASMLGYVAPEKSTYKTFVKSIRGNIFSNVGIFNYGISEVSINTNSPFPDKTNEIRYYAEPSQYTGVSSNFVSAVHDINSRLSNSNIPFAMLVTDGVLDINGQGNDLAEIKAAFNTSIRQHNCALSVIGIKSRFDGKIFCEKGGSFNTNTERPFYIFLISNTSYASEHSRIESSIIQKYGTSRIKKFAPIDQLTYACEKDSLPNIISSGKRDIFYLVSVANDTINYLFNKKLRFGNEALLKIPLKINNINGLYKHSELFLPNINITTTDNIDADQYRIDKTNTSVNLLLNNFFTDHLREEKAFTIFITPELIQEKNVRSVWNDWSTSDDSDASNAGKTLNISLLLTYLQKQAIIYTRDSWAPNQMILRVRFHK